MKKLAILLLVLVLSVCALVACEGDGADTKRPPAATKGPSGITPAVTTAVSGCLHDWQEGDYVEAPSCTEGGSVSMVCTLCNETRTEAVPAAGHTPETVTEKAATCTEAGHTAGKVCSVCDETLEGCEVIPATGIHTPEEIPAVEATCGEAGATAGEKCSVCDTVITVPEEVPATGEHTPEEIPAIEATCSEAGATAGEKCSVCDTVITAPEEIPATGEHDYKAGVVVTAPAYGVKGETTYECKNCDYVKSEEVPALTYRPEDIWDGTKATAFAGGSGTVDDPYLISNAKEFAYFKQSISSSRGANTYYKLTADIVLNDVSNWESWNASTAPANKWTAIPFFNGHLDGDGHAIRGVYSYQKWNSNGSNPYWALFGRMEAGSLKNLTVCQSYISAKESVGGIVCRVNATSYSEIVIDNCHFSGRLEGYQVGGIVAGVQVGTSSGMNVPTSGHFKIQNCTAEGTFTTNDTRRENEAKGNVAGILAYAYLYDGSLKLSNCVNNATLSGFTVGGIYSGGENKALNGNSFTFTIENCKNNGAIKAASGAPYGGGTVGGIAGALNGSASHTVNILNCENRGTVSGGYNCGGIIGNLHYSKLDNYSQKNYVGLKNYGSVSSSLETCYVGGLVGYAYITAQSYSSIPSLYLKNCLNEGDVTSSFYAGGLAAYASGINYSQCYNAGTVYGKVAAGGLEAECESARVLDCYNCGAITSDMAAGGFFGKITYYDLPTVKTSYNVGKVSLTEAAESTAKVGAILGDPSDYWGQFENNVRDNKVYYIVGCAQNKNGSEAYLYGGASSVNSYRITEANSTKQNAYSGFDFSSTWEISGEGEYRLPTLKRTKATPAS